MPIDTRQFGRADRNMPGARGVLMMGIKSLLFAFTPLPGRYRVR
jgi:hypothetical protein